MRKGIRRLGGPWEYLCEVPMWCNGCSVWRAVGTAKTVTRVP